MKNNENIKERNNNKKIKKIKISNLFYQMNPLRDPNVKIKLIENLFLNNCIQNNLEQKENHPMSERKDLPKIKIKNLKNVHGFCTGKTPLTLKKNNIKNIHIILNHDNSNKNSISNDSNIQQKKDKNLLITSLILPQDNKNFNIQINNSIGNKIQNKFSRINKNKYHINMKKNINLNLLEKNNNSENENNYIYKRNSSIYDIKRYYRSNMILPKITKKYIMPSFENNKSKEINDIISLKQYEMKEIEESIKVKPFIH